MGRKLHIFIPDESLNEHAYYAYLHQCLSLNPHLILSETRRFDTSQAWEAHFCQLVADLNTGESDYDIEKFFGADVTLYQNIHPEGFWKLTEKYPWRLQLESSCCLRGLILEFLMAQEAQKLFSGVLIGDENHEDTESEELYSEILSFSKHAVRVLENVYGTGKLQKESHIDQRGRLKL